MTDRIPHIFPPDNVRLPAEWENDGAVLLAWPHANTDWNYMLHEAQDCYVRIAEAIIPYQKLMIISPDPVIPQLMLDHLPKDRIIYVYCETNDTWARDFGPISVCDTKGQYYICDFQFNGWGLKFPSALDNQITRTLLDRKAITAPPIECRNFTMEGGGIESDGNGSLMTTALCQLSPNRNAALSKEEIISYLKLRFNACNVLWLEHGYLAGDDTDSHIDTLARFAPDDTILYVGCDDPSDEHYAELLAMETELKSMLTPDNRPYNLIRLPLPDPIYDENGLRLPATYANFLSTPRAIIMPTYGQPMKDKLAQQIINIAFNVPVITVDCRQLIRQHGSLHCVTMQLPQQILPI